MAYERLLLLGRVCVSYFCGPVCIWLRRSLNSTYFGMPEKLSPTRTRPGGSSRSRLFCALVGFYKYTTACLESARSLASPPFAPPINWIQFFLGGCPAHAAHPTERLFDYKIMWCGYDCASGASLGSFVVALFVPCWPNRKLVEEIRQTSIAETLRR